MDEIKADHILTFNNCWRATIQFTVLRNSGTQPLMSGARNESCAAHCWPLTWTEVMLSLSLHTNGHPAFQPHRLNYTVSQMIKITVLLRVTANTCWAHTVPQMRMVQQMCEFSGMHWKSFTQLQPHLTPTALELSHPSRKKKAEGLQHQL